jgi:hypothetical protein
MSTGAKAARIDFTKTYTKRLGELRIYEANEGGKIQLKQRPQFPFSAHRTIGEVLEKPEKTDSGPVGKYRAHLHHPDAAFQQMTIKITQTTGIATEVTFEPSHLR